MLRSAGIDLRLRTDARVDRPDTPTDGDTRQAAPGRGAATFAPGAGADRGHSRPARHGRGETWATWCGWPRSVQDRDRYQGARGHGIRGVGLAARKATSDDRTGRRESPDARGNDRR